ncbi:uncharacterized protein LOC134222323 [Armigeres subalbatus]|uniref:uncharacterized protein LOC134222323 n=1 Tax=Armigeres subalbatus TaxID=124917 RepID=UPI002ED4016E
MKGTTAAKTIEALEKVFIEQTYPEAIRSDNGPPFASEEFAQYCLSKNIRLIHTIPYWPQMNGMVERENQGVLRALRIARATGVDWRKAIRDYVHMYNTTPHSMTEKAPLELLMGRPVKDLLPSLRTEPTILRDEGVRDNDAMKKLKGKLYADEHRHAKPSSIEIGDFVMLKSYESGKLEPNFQLDRFKVVERTGNDVIVESEEGVQYRRCVTHLKKWPKATHTYTEHRVSENEPEQGPKPSNLPGTKKSEGKRGSGENTLQEPSSKRPIIMTKKPSRFNV